MNDDYKKLATEIAIKNAVITYQILLKNFIGSCSGFIYADAQ